MLDNLIFTENKYLKLSAVSKILFFGYDNIPIQIVRSAVEYLSNPL